MNITRALLLTSTLTLGACASIIEGSTDRVQVVTSPATSSSCQLQNSQGTWNVVTPGSTEVKKSKTDLNITCKDNATGAQSDKIVESNMEPWFLGNIILGGIIGGIVDASTGSMWEYPADVTVPLSITPPAPAAAAPITFTPAPAFSTAPVMQTAPAPAPAVNNGDPYAFPAKQ